MSLPPYAPENRLTEYFREQEETRRSLLVFDQEASRELDTVVTSRECRPDDGHSTLSLLMGLAFIVVMGVAIFLSVTKDPNAPSKPPAKPERRYYDRR